MRPVRNHLSGYRDRGLPRIEKDEASFGAFTWRDAYSTATLLILRYLIGKTMNMKLILVCKEGDARQAYLNEMKALGVEVDVVASYYEFLKTRTSTPYQGLMIDLVTQMKMSMEEKNVSKEILGFFPTIQLKWDAESGSIRNISLGKTTSSGSLKEFIHNECQILYGQGSPSEHEENGPLKRITLQ